jgi:hypothetical protein
MFVNVCVCVCVCVGVCVCVCVRVLELGGLLSSWMCVFVVRWLVLLATCYCMLLVIKVLIRYVCRINQGLSASAPARVKQHS